MNSKDIDKSERDRRLDEVVTAYLKDIEIGRAPNQPEWLARYPDLAAELADFFAAQDQVDHLAAPLRLPAPVPPGDANAEALTLAPGETVEAKDTLGTVRYFGDYELLKEIARGGMGVVYKARQVKLQRIVAVKMILAGELANPTDVERFQTEARAAANLHHASVVAIHEVGQHNGHHYFSMDYVAGESLAHRIARGPLPPREAAALMSTVARAVAYAHVEGVIHRDLKPANILLDEKGEPHVTDFGLAKRLRGEPGESAPGTELTQTGQVLGTASYMPPEQAAGKTKEIGPRSDVYSLGAVLYCALTARPPFQAASTFDTLLQVLDREPVPARSLNSAVPRDLETICLKCLEKDPTRRYGSAQELADELQRFLDGKPINARPITRRERVAKWMRRRPTAAALVGVSRVAAASLVVLGIALVVNSGRLADEAGKREIAERERANLITKEAELLNAQITAARSHVYSTEISLAGLALDRNDSTGLANYLDGLRPKVGETDLCGFEWHYLWRKNNPERLSLAKLGFLPPPDFTLDYERDRFTDRRQLALSSDGKFLATTKDVCDALSGKVLIEYDEDRDCKVFFSPDSKILFASWTLFDLSRPSTLSPKERGKREGFAIPRAPDDRFVPLGFVGKQNALVVMAAWEPAAFDCTRWLRARNSPCCASTGWPSFRPTARCWSPSAAGRITRATRSPSGMWPPPTNSAR